MCRYLHYPYIAATNNNPVSETDQDAARPVELNIDRYVNQLARFLYSSIVLLKIIKRTKSIPMYACVARGAIWVGTDGYRLLCILFCFVFSESWSVTNSVRYPFPNHVFAPQIFGRSVGQKLSASFSPLHRTLDRRSASRANMKRLIAKISKKKHLVSSVYSDAVTHLSIILFLFRIFFTIVEVEHR